MGMNVIAASYSYSPHGTAGLLFDLGVLSLVALELVAFYRIFRKASRPGWAAVIPIYNFYVLVKVSGKSGWLLFLLLVPIFGLIVEIIVMYSLAQRFGKGIGFAAGLVLLGPIFLPILAFGAAQYRPFDDRVRSDAQPVNSVWDEQ